MTHKQQNQTVLSGIEQLPWGAHACHVYRSREDLVERLVPYFAAGLRANEACLWITAGPLDARGAEELMVEAVPEFGACLAKGQIEIHDAKEWYSPGGRFDAASVVEVWLEREQQALRAGYSGLRLSGDTSWVERTARDDFMEYERRLGDAFRGRRLIALCTYSMDHCSPQDTHEIARCHEFALARPPSSTTPAATLGDVLYGNRPKVLVPERDWVALVRSVAGGDQLALHALYERAHRPVFTLAVRICGSRETAEEVTLDVFHDLWRRASGYDPANGTVLGWIMNQARSRAIDRLRFDQRKKRSDPDGAEPGAETEADISRDVLELKEQSAAVQAALVLLTPEERQAIETAFFHELTHVEVAARLNQPLGTIKTRIRSGLHKLRQALAAEVKGR
jgi:RNA polymerase sigma factor (sigma-70 family)